MLGPLSAVLLVYDLHTPKRFYNMLRIAKRTSPMSIGTWILMSFSGFAVSGAAAQFLSDRVTRLGMDAPGGTGERCACRDGRGRALHLHRIPAVSDQHAVMGGRAKIAGCALRRIIRRSRCRIALAEANVRAPPGVSWTPSTVAALAAELAATLASHETYQRKGVAEALDGGWGQVEKIGVTALGTALPLGLQLASVVLARRKPGVLSNVASVAGAGGQPAAAGVDAVVWGQVSRASWDKFPVFPAGEPAMTAAPAVR